MRERRDVEKIVRIAQEELSAARNTAEQGKAARIWLVSIFFQVISTATHCNTGHHQWFERASDNEAGKAGDHGSIACRKLLGAVHW